MATQKLAAAARTGNGVRRYLEDIRKWRQKRGVPVVTATCSCEGFRQHGTDSGSRKLHGGGSGHRKFVLAHHLGVLAATGCASAGGVDWVKES